MKRNRLETIDNEMFRSLTPEEYRMTMGGVSRTVTGKVTFSQAEAFAEEAAGGVDGEADVSFDF